MFFLVYLYSYVIRFVLFVLWERERQSNFSYKVNHEYYYRYHHYHNFLLHIDNTANISPKTIFFFTLLHNCEYTFKSTTSWIVFPCRQMKAILILIIALSSKTKAHRYHYGGDDINHIPGSKWPQEIQWHFKDLYNKEFEESTQKDESFFGWSYPKNPIIDAMTKSVQSLPNKDLFSCLRDDYPLPKGLFRYNLN